MTRSTPSTAATSRISTGLSAPATASKAAAVAQAAHDVLVGLTPATLPLVKTRIDDMLTASLAMIDAGPAKTAGHRDRRRGGRRDAARAERPMVASTSSRSPTSNDVGKWRLVAPLINNVFGQFATVTPLTMTSPASGAPAACPPSRAPSTPRNSTRSRRWVRSRDRAGRRHRPCSPASHGQSARVLQPRAPRDRRGQGLVDDRTGTPVRQDEHGISRRADRLLGQQGALD